MKAIVTYASEHKTGALLTLYLPHKKNIIKKLTTNSIINIEIDEMNKRRSLSQNAYAWTLISKIADELKEDKEFIYFNMLQSYGQSTMVAVKDNEVEKFKKTQKYYEEEEGRNGWKYFKIYAGSSLYNKEEMSIFLKGIVHEAEQLNITTLTPAEIEGLNLH